MPALLVGLASKVVALFRGRCVSGKWPVALGYLISFGLFSHFVVVAGGERKLLAAAPLLLMFVAAGIWGMLSGKFLPSVPVRVRVALFAVLVGAGFVANVHRVPPKAVGGFAPIASDLLSRPEFASSIILVSSNSEGEGMLISEVAMREQRPGHIVLRGSKVLASSGWFGGGYQARYSTLGELMSFIRDIPVDVLVLDLASEREHGRQLREMVDTYPEQWRLVGAYSRRYGHREPSPVLVYQSKNHQRKAAGKIRIDMRRSLGKFIEK